MHHHGWRAWRSVAVTVADGFAEREAATTVLSAHWRHAPPRHRTVGADKAYDTADFVDQVRQVDMTPHVAPERHPPRRKRDRCAHATPATPRAGTPDRALSGRLLGSRPFGGGVHRPPGKAGNYRPGVSTDSGPPPPPGRAPSASACEPHRELIAEALGRGRNAMAIWQDLVDDHGFPARYAVAGRD